MKVQFILLLVASSFVQSSPLHARNSKGLTRQKANEEVRSIISAIVDAILDGDRKRRSEVEDFDDESTHDGNPKHTKVNEAQDETMKKRKFSKRQEDEDNSVPLANVMATSDVNSTEDQNEIFKKDIIGHVDDKNTLKNVLKKSEYGSGGESMDNEGISEIQLPKFLYGMINDEESSSSRNEGKESHEISAEEGSKTTADDTDKKIKNKEGTVGKDAENNNKKTGSKKTNKKEKITPELSPSKKTHKKSAKKTTDGKRKKHDNERSVAESYSDFLKIAKNPNPLVKHESIKHVRDDSEMNEDPSIFEKTTKLQESEETMDTDEEEDVLSESKRNKDKKEDDDSTEESSDKSKADDDDHGTTNQGEETDDQDDDDTDNQGAETNNHDGDTNDHDNGDTNNHDGDTNDQDGETNNHDGDTNDQDGDTNDHDGETNNHDGDTNDQDGETNNHDGDTNDQDGENNNHDDDTNDHDSETNNHDGDTNDQDGETNNEDSETSNQDEETDNEDDETDENADNHDMDNSKLHFDVDSTTEKHLNKPRKTEKETAETLPNSTDHSKTQSEDMTSTDDPDREDNSNKDQETSHSKGSEDDAMGSEADSMGSVDHSQEVSEDKSSSSQDDEMKSVAESNGSSEESQSEEKDDLASGSADELNDFHVVSDGSQQDSDGSQKDSDGSQQDSDGSQQDGMQQDSYGTQKDSKEKQKDSKEEQKDSKEKQKDSKETHNKSPVESQEEANGSKQDSNEPQQDPNGSKDTNGSQEGSEEKQKETHNKTPMESQQDSDALKEDSNGSQQDLNGSQLESNEPQQDSNEPQQDSNGPQQDSNGPQQDSNGPQQDSNGSQQDSNEPQQDSNGPQQDSKGSQQDSNELQQDSDGSQQDSNGPQQDSNGSQQDSNGPQQDVNGSQQGTALPQVSNGLQQDPARLASKEKYLKSSQDQVAESGPAGNPAQSRVDSSDFKTPNAATDKTPPILVNEDKTDVKYVNNEETDSSLGKSSGSEVDDKNNFKYISTENSGESSGRIAEDGAKITANDINTGSADIEEDGSTGNSEIEASSYEDSSQAPEFDASLQNNQETHEKGVALEKNKKVISNNIDDEVSSEDDNSNDGEATDTEEHQTNDSEQSKSIDENDSMDTGSSSEDSSYDDTTRNEEEKDNNNTNQKPLKITSKTKHGAASTSINDMQSPQTAENKDKEVKPEESGKIIETSYRFNDEDTPDDEDFKNQGNEAWTGSSNQDPVLIGDDTPDLTGEDAGIAMDENPQVQDDSRLVTNQPSNDNGIYEDSLNKQAPDLKQWEHSKMQIPPPSNDYNWMENALANNQESNLETIQDRLQDYQNTEWNGRETPYLNKGQRQEYQTTEQPELERKTSIPKGNKLSNPPTKSQHYTAPADAFTDNDVFGYAGSIGPFLQKRTFIPNKLDEPSETAKKGDILESLMTDVDEPWIKKFLSKTLKMAVNGNKEILRSEDDDKRQSEESKASKKTTEQDDAMPLDATNNKDTLDDEDDPDQPATHSTEKDDYSIGDEYEKQKEKDEEKSDDLNEALTTHENIPDSTSESNGKMEGLPLSEVVKHIPMSKSPVADIGTIPSQGDSPIKSVIRITARVPSNPSFSTPEQIPSNQQDPFQTSPPRSSPEIIPSTPKLPELVPLDPPPSVVGTLEPNISLPPFTENQSPKPAPTSNNQIVDPSTPVAPKQDVTSSNQAKQSPQQNLTPSNLAASAVIGPIIKVITSPAKTVTVKDERVDKENGKIQTEINNALNNSIQNIGISSANDVLENTIKEAELIQVLKDAIPVNQRRPVGTEDDLKRGLDDLKDYAVALTEAKGLSQTQRNGVVEKLARDLLDEMRVMDGRKQKLLNELMSFVTAMEVSTFKERLKEIKSQVISVSSQNPEDTEKIRSTAIKLLDELFEELPLPKGRIEKTEKQIGQSNLLKSLIKAGEKRVLRSKLKKALTDLVADKLL
ncbi:dentin sialophosphoprotein-like isoform X2 [Dendronephthya gigantea]|uniref:dentin sialophosphoprotein-like isoform X2 n=1 Tax=Dendronephthya gigantea TaxID=151771 RepID=UPI00106C0F85|nr:dentin sialophosphoprotein-like isoform X2 [Dendronephthya gigantea]